MGQVFIFRLAARLAFVTFSFLTSVLVVPVWAEPKHSLDPSVRVRYADLQDGTETGAAASLLFRARVSSEWTPQVSTLLELDHVQSFLQNKHSDGKRFNGEPEIPDVPGSDINQAVVILGADGLRAHLGRQAINIGNERFIGSVGAWQNEQTFDAALIKGKFLSRSTIQYAYIARANRIFGRDAGANLNQGDVNFEASNGRRPLGRLGEHDHQTHLLNIELKEWDYWELGAFGLLLDNQDVTALNSDTWGMRVAAHYKPDVLQWRVEAEVAGQKYETGFDGWIPYYRLKAGVERNTHEVSVNLEILDAKDGTPFRTTLATNHDFQGWADVFGTLPSGGLQDRFLKYTWRQAPWKLDLRWHQFSTQDNDLTLGQEIDADIVYKINRRQNVLLRVAHYEADALSGPGSNDRQRVIFSYTHRF